jgi:hypothetical protein
MASVVLSRALLQNEDCGESLHGFVANSFLTRLMMAAE